MENMFGYYWEVHFPVWENCVARTTLGLKSVFLLYEITTHQQAAQCKLKIRVNIVDVCLIVQIIISIFLPFFGKSWRSITTISSLLKASISLIYESSAGRLSLPDFLNFQIAVYFK